MTAPSVAEPSRNAGFSAGGGTRDHDVYAQCAEFLFTEAELLDNRRFADWLECIHPELVYEIPIRVTLGMEHLDGEFSTRGFHMRETHKSMEMRVRRLETEHAFAENPPSRTTRLVTNVRLTAATGPDAEVKSNFMLYRSHGGSTRYDLLVGERHDLLRATDAGWKLARRTVLLVHTTVPTSNLGVFL